MRKPLLVACIGALACACLAGAAAAGEGRLDGLAFSIDIGPEDRPADTLDRLEFENGLFRSAECERICGYPPQPYFTRPVPDGVEFIAELACPEKDATLVWRGTVDGARIEGTMHWRAERWYWTIERDFRFEGVRDDPGAGGDAAEG